MSLLRSLLYSDEDYQRVLSFTQEQCELVALKVDLELTFNAAKKPGDTLMKALDRRGYNVTEFRELLLSIKNLYAYAVVTYYKPQVKVAILIGNDKYQFLSKLSTATADCETIASNLKVMGFVILTVMNTTGNQLKNILKNIFMEIPENSYCFIVYAGHGCEICNTKFMLGIDCPLENITNEHCVSENFVLKEVAVCKPDLCILIMDMCRLNLDRRSNPALFSYLPYIEEYSIHKNLIIAYSTLSSESAYEVVQIECSETIDINVPYELQPGDTDKIILGTVSQYVKALTKRLQDDLDISSLLDKVHRDVEKSIMKQRPLKVQCGVDKRSLYDFAVIDDLSDIGQRLHDITLNCGGISNIHVCYQK